MSTHHVNMQSALEFPVVNGNINCVHLVSRTHKRKIIENLTYKPDFAPTVLSCSEPSGRQPHTGHGHAVSGTMAPGLYAPADLCITVYLSAVFHPVRLCVGQDGGMGIIRCHALFNHAFQWLNETLGDFSPHTAL